MVGVELLRINTTDLKLLCPAAPSYPASPVSPLTLTTLQAPHTPFVAVLVYIHIELVEAVEDQLAGLVVGLPGLLTTEEYIISKEAVSVSC